MRVLSGCDGAYETVGQSVMGSSCPKSTGEAAGDANTLNTLLYGHAKTQFQCSSTALKLFYLPVRQKEMKDDTLYDKGLSARPLTIPIQ